MRGWSDEDQYIRDYYPSYSATELAIRLNRTERAVRQRASILGVRRQHKTAIAYSYSKNIDVFQSKGEDAPILRAFFSYVEQARKIALDHDINPDVDALINVFRDIYCTSSVSTYLQIPRSKSNAIVLSPNKYSRFGG